MLLGLLPHLRHLLLILNREDVELLIRSAGTAASRLLILSLLLHPRHLMTRLSLLRLLTHLMVSNLL